ncbi:uncharacterized protein V6R79_024633 [Siganus canaliculatus]
MPRTKQNNPKNLKGESSVRWMSVLCSGGCRWLFDMFFFVAVKPDVTPSDVAEGERRGHFLETLLTGIDVGKSGRCCSSCPTAGTSYERGGRRAEERRWGRKLRENCLKRERRAAGGELQTATKLQGLVANAGKWDESSKNWSGSEDVHHHLKVIYSEEKRR